MAQPDTSKKVVDQTGYIDEVDAPFTSNYQELYREMLVKNRLLYEKIDQIEQLIGEINDLVAGDENDIKALVDEVQELIDADKDGTV
jgi:ornithine cyclodeaminase/alanine dehydrogenase-like protein (mu-crystallin family)